MRFDIQRVGDGTPIAAAPMAATVSLTKKSRDIDESQYLNTALKYWHDHETNCGQKSDLLFDLSVAGFSC
ncbi:MAG TPA: hypothetical protein VGH13_20200 [Xanthobacteraceae bacterium]|jgi:hypothetical protein